MGTTTFDVTVEDQVAHLVLNRPDQLNTMNRAFWNELPAAVRELDASGTVRCLVISSTGRHFTAGMDLSVFTGGGPSSGLVAGSDRAITETGRVRAQLRLTAKLVQQSFSCFEEARFPVLVAVQGGCVGGGVDLVCATDCRYATADAWFCVQEINIGMAADVGTLQRLPKLIPDGLARQLAYTGERLPADRAKDLGLVNEVYDDHETMVAAVLDIAHQIARQSPLAIWGSKVMLTHARDHSVAAGLEYVATWQTGMFQPADMAEAFAAKAEGRDPVYEDLLPRPEVF